ncbi:hypothetical protein PaecuDRAFT_1006 [Paenibacillus curdlanolyticus YK9]|uniref:Protein-glutamine gamma-glutamyltransferase-like C-terminal domain-containing protein n=1 Tax=Paenibacillus curdlanolyticus YK9 TaxID=717606 RepID=E0I5T4_9BACL|nr:DUF4129 domain-containing protein [Paenibacillus curdlanolyticus]EFM12326.1 hypothetical protein PaecuDRAFT_1006 [Paenibacillus curdlanolyticus YK9]
MTQVNFWQHPAARTVLRALLLLLLFLPIAVSLARLALPEDRTVGWLLFIPFVHAAGQTIERLLGKYGRWLTLGLVIVIVLTLSYGWFGFTQAGVLSAIIYGFFGIHGTVLPADGRVSTLPTAMYLFALLLDFICPLLLQNHAGSASYVPWVNADIAITVIVSLFIWNHRHLEREAHPDQKKSGVARSILWQNRLLVAAMGAVVLFLALLPALSEALRRALTALLHWISQFFASSPGEPKKQQTASMPPPQSALPGKPAEPSNLLLLLERITTYVVVIVVTLLALWAIYKLIRITPGLARMMQQWLQRIRGRERLAAIAAGYEDELELIEPNRSSKRRSSIIGRLLRKQNEEEWSALADNAARIRYLYRTALLNRQNLGYTPKPQLTPRETAEELRQNANEKLVISQDIVNLYESVRYGEHPVTDEETATARQLERKQPKR